MIQHRCFPCPALLGDRAPMTLLALALVLTPFAAANAAPAGAGVDPSRESIKDAHRVRVCGGGRGEVTLEVDGQQLSVTRREGDKLTTTVVDLDQLGRLVGDAVGEAMSTVQELQLQVRLGQDNRVNVTSAEGEFEVDLDQIMSQVAAAVQVGMQDLDTSTWTTRRVVTDSGVVHGDEDLQQELADLQDEMRALREELQRLRKQADNAAPKGR